MTTEEMVRWLESEITRRDEEARVLQAEANALREVLSVTRQLKAKETS